MVALFYGELVAAPLLMLVILLRFHSNWYMLVRVPRATISLLIAVSVFQALVTAITWCVSGLPLLAFWPIESMRRHLTVAYAAAVPMALLAPGLLTAALWYSRHRYPATPFMHKALFFQTAIFMLVASAVAINRYFKLTRQAEAVLAEQAANRG
jgi:hypothetical protein